MRFGPTVTTGTAAKSTFSIRPPRIPHRRGHRAPVVAPGLLIAGCDGPLSTLDPAGTAAAGIMQLFIVMAAVAVMVWLAVMALAIYAARARRGDSSVRLGHRMIVVGGVAAPALLLGILAFTGLRMTNAMLAPARGDGLVVHVTGERWWWRVRYERPGMPPVHSANEIRMPVGERVQFRLGSADVIHSFWIPSLGGKMDMLPGRQTTLVLDAERPGRYRGVCAEFCGTSHALMEFDVVAMDGAEFGKWLASRTDDAAEPANELARRGQALFLDNGCGGCHRIAGTAADGRVGPDLTHVGSRLSIAAGTLPNDVAALAGWISHAGRVKPEAPMPAYPALDAGQLLAIATYLDGLR